VEVALHNQDNREHDIFDSDDYLQYHGGMIATIRSLTGRQPRAFFGDSHNPDQPQVRGLKEEVLRVFRSRVANPKWIASIQQHGYKGGLELTATVDYLFGYDATAHVVDDWVYEELAARYALDPAMQQFLPTATRGRSMPSANACWKPPSASCGSSPSRKPWPRCNNCI
jgi:cobaltochelatase CobN